MIVVTLTVNLLGYEFGYLSKEHRDDVKWTIFCVVPAPKSTPKDPRDYLFVHLDDTPNLRDGTSGKVEVLTGMNYSYCAVGTTIER